MKKELDFKNLSECADNMLSLNKIDNEDKFIVKMLSVDNFINSEIQLNYYTTKGNYVDKI
jgi:hypothetical protein